MYNANSSPDELLHAYIDNELEPELEPQLYAHLAADGDLRSRLRQLRGLRAETRRFGAVAVPPPELTTAVFARLGFTASKVKPSHIVGAALLLRNAWAPVASAAAAAILTATVIFGLQGTPSEMAKQELAVRQNQPAASERASSKTSQDYLKSASTNPATHSSSYRNSEKAAPASERTRSVPVTSADNTSHDAITRTEPADDLTASTLASDAANASGDQSTQSTEPADDLTASTLASDAANASGDLSTQSADHSADLTESPALATNVPPSAAVQSKPRTDVLPTDDAMNSNEHRTPSSPFESPVSSSASGTPGVLAQQGVPGQEVIDTRRYFPSLAGPGLNFISVELRGVSAASFPNVTIGTRSDPWMANMAAAVYYSDDQDDFGLEYGQEPFSQHYSGVEYGKAVRYEQNLLASWILAGYRHRFTPWRALGSIEPYIATSFGATLEAWPLARAGMGIMYMPDRRVRFHVGLEGSLLAYPFQDKWFTSKRAGLSYGISVLL
ncbi:MAG: zf-HC2 domain-containing protein [Bacteroidota bacterium]